MTDEPEGDTERLLREISRMMTEAEAETEALLAEIRAGT